MSDSKKKTPSGGQQPAAAEPASTAPKKKRLLLIEDENAARIVLLQKLRAAGFDVDLAPNGRVALEKLRSSRPDAIFMDLLLPQVKGVDVIKEARREKTFGDRPIYVCTSAANMKAWTERGTKAGATKVFDRAATAIDAIVAAIAADIIGASAGTGTTEPQPEVNSESEQTPTEPTKVKSVTATVAPQPTPPPAAPPSPKDSTLADYRPQPSSFFHRALKVFGISKPDGSPATPAASNPTSPAPSAAVPSAAVQAAPVSPAKPVAIRPATIEAPNRPSVAAAPPPSPQVTAPNETAPTPGSSTVVAPSMGHGGAVLTLDQAGKIISADEGCVAMFGWDSAMLADVDLKVLLKTGLEQGIDSFLRRHRGGGDSSKSSSSAPLIARRRDGTEFPVSVTTLTWSTETTLTRKTDGPRACWTAVFRDLSVAANPSAAIAPDSISLGAAAQPTEDMSRLQQSNSVLQRTNSDLQRQMQQLSAETTSQREAIAKGQQEREEWEKRIRAKEQELTLAKAASEQEKRVRKQLEQQIQELAASKAAAGQGKSVEDISKAPAALREQFAAAQAAAERSKSGAAFDNELASAHRMGEEMTKLRQGRDELAAKLTAAEQAVAESKRRSEDLEARLRETMGDLECLKADAVSRTEEREGQESALREQLSEAQRAAEKEVARNQELEKRLHVLGDNLRQEQNERSKRFEQELAALRTERDDLNVKLTTEQQAVAESKRRAEEFESRLKENADEFARAKAELDKQNTDRKRSEAEWRSQLETANALTRTLEQACAEAVERNSLFEGELAVLQQQRDELQRKLAEEQSAAVEPKRRIEELEARLRENANELVRVKTQLQNVRSDKTAEMQLASLEQVRDALSAKLTTERWATSESKKRTQDLEAKLHANSAELERIKSDRDKETEVHARLESELREQLDATKVAVEQVAAALTEKAAKCNLLQTELATLQQSRDELSGKLTTEQQAAAESRQRSQELEDRLRESTAEAERFKAEREKQAEQQARLDLELQSQVAAAKATTEQVEANLRREAARCSRLEEELVSSQKERRQLRDKLDVSQQAESRSKQRIREFEEQLRSRDASLGSVKLELQNQTAERGRVESDLRTQLEAAKDATQRTEAARLEQASQRSRLEGELAGLRRGHDELSANWKSGQRAVEESQRRIIELESGLGEKVAELQRAKSTLETQSAERGRLEAELRSQLEAAKGTAQQTEAARQEQATQRGRLQEEFGALKKSHEELSAKLKTEQSAVEESKRRAAELEKNLRDASTELQRAKSTSESQSTERGRIESELRSQLEAAKGTAKEAEGGRQEQLAQRGRLEKELAGLRKKHDELGAKGKSDRQAVEDARRRIADLEKEAREKATELQRTKTAFENQSGERGRVESDLRTQLEAAKGAAQKATAAQQEIAMQRGKLQEELNALKKGHDELGARCKTEQTAVEESKRRAAELEKALSEKAAELQRAKTALENQAAERARPVPPPPKPSGNTEALTKELCRLREDEAVRNVELGDLRRQAREGVGTLARLTADLEKERAERHRIEQRITSLNTQLKELHDGNKQHLASAESTQKRIMELEQQLRDREDSVSRVSADLNKEASSRQLAEEQLRSTADLNGHLRNCLSSFELAKKGFKRMQEELEARQKANLAALKETESKLQVEAAERKRLEDALTAAQRNFEEQGQQSSLELAKLQSELEVEKFEQKRLQGEAIQSRYSSLDSARVGQAMVNSFRKQIEQPVDQLMQSTRRLLESQLEGEQKKLVESLLENALVLRTNLQDSGSTNVAGDRGGSPVQGQLKVEPVRPPGLAPPPSKPNFQP